MAEKIRLLFVDDEEKFLNSMTTRLSMRDLDVSSFSNGADALAASKKQSFDVALLDLKMPGMDGEELLGKLKEQHSDLEVVILTGHGSIKSAVDLTRQGAFEYLQKPCEIDDLITSISNAYAKRIVARKSAKSQKVEALLAKAVGYSPIELLNKLKEIEDGD
jgi:DNA-binding NtrC family response regulator